MQSIMHFLYSLVKEMTNKPLNVTATANLFFSVNVIGMTCFNECFLFYVITEVHYNSNIKLIKFVIVNLGKISCSSLFFELLLCDCCVFFFTNSFLFAQSLWKHVFTNMYEN